MELSARAEEQILGYGSRNNSQSHIMDLAHQRSSYLLQGHGAFKSEIYNLSCAQNFAASAIICVENWTPCVLPFSVQLYSKSVFHSTSDLKT